MTEARGKISRHIGEAEATTRRTNVVPGHHDKEKLGIWFFLGSEVILFTTLILTYGLFRINYGNEYGSFKSHLNIPLIGINTFVLVMSSYFVVRTLQAAREDRTNALFGNLLLVLALGSLFIAGQAYEWSKLFAEGIKLDNTFGSPFLIVTGIHGTHVLIGLAWASILLFLGLDDRDSGGWSRAIEFFGLYWHFVDIVWIVLFSLIYLL
ncbi:MAG TPA: heme-copper oxidase subunit III [Anaerolineales bacterium]|nr:heme-copper oxidase subunit III [Anaerolineales bacterium]